MQLGFEQRCVRRRLLVAHLLSFPRLRGPSAGLSSSRAWTVIHLYAVCHNGNLVGRDCVAPGPPQYSRRSLPLTSALVPTDTKLEMPSPIRAACSRATMPTARCRSCHGYRLRTRPTFSPAQPCLGRRRLVSHNLGVGGGRDAGRLAAGVCFAIDAAGRAGERLFPLHVIDAYRCSGMPPDGLLDETAPVVRNEYRLTCHPD
jgi:hypothetical protein